VGDGMSELRIDFQPHSAFPWVGLVLLVMALTVLAFAGSHYQKLNEKFSKIEAITQQNLKAAQRATAAQTSLRSSADLTQEVSNANEVLRQLSVPWESLFQAVESSEGGKVTLLALEPDVSKHLVKITGETKSFKTMTKYLSQLQEQKIFGSVYLQSHQVQQQDPDKPIRFSLLATWREKI
jgi:Tfp pilus assembly protein PilN